MNTFIKVIEVWTPAPDNQGLKLANTIYSDSGNGEIAKAREEFKKASELRLFSYNEGLPGKAWAQVRPLIITDLEHSYFQRKELAARAGLSVGVAIPIFSGEFLIAVIVFLCGEGRDLAGAIELWGVSSGNAGHKTNELSLIDGYYGALGKLENVSRELRFSKGSGLPGSVWDYRIPMLVTNMANSSLFKRASTAAVEGITSAIGLPFNYYTGKEYIVTFLSAYSTPIALQYEIWLPEREHHYLFLHAGEREIKNNLIPLDKKRRIKPGEGLIGTVWTSGIPAISRKLSEDGLLPKGFTNGLKTGFVMPVIEEGFLRSIVVFMF